MMNDKQLLIEIYRQHPCRTLPNALWKTMSAEDDLSVNLQQGLDHRLRSLEVWQESQLMAFWCADVNDQPLSSTQVRDVPFALVHSAALPIFERRQFSHQEAYFRLIHKESPPLYVCPPGFNYKDAHPQREIDAVTKFLKSCYQELDVDESVVRSWLKHPVYDPNLWVWIMDEAANTPAALGIAELDRRVPEGSLEWIQVLPPYLKQGLGKAVVAELLRRISGKAEFTTVAGKIKNLSQPDRLYRRCGFTGRDVWWLLNA